MTRRFFMISGVGFLLTAMIPFVARAGNPCASSSKNEPIIPTKADIRRETVFKASEAFIPSKTRNITEALRMYIEEYNISDMKVFITREQKN